MISAYGREIRMTKYQTFFICAYMHTYVRVSAAHAHLVCNARTRSTHSKAACLSSSRTCLMKVDHILNIQTSRIFFN